MSGDCQSVIPEEGVQKTCTITADDAEPATLSVTTQVDGGAWLPEDFTVHLTSGGVELPGSPQPGSDKGTAFTVPPGRYVLSQDAARGYAAKIGGACAADGAVTLEPGASVSCTIVNGVVPVGDGLVVESYAPARTDGDWGLTEPYLILTRGYLENPANFGPNGIVTRLLRVTPGIRVANPRTLDGVDVLFTGWVPTFSYTDAERDALRAFVLGGGTLIATTDDTGHTIVDLFGLTQGDGGGNPTPNTITNPGHPIANGAFGAVTTFNQYAATGHYPTLGPDAVEVGRNAQGTSLAVIERGKLGPGSGAAIFVADVDVFSDHGGATENATLIKNLFAFAAGEGPLPALTVGDAAGAEGNAGGRVFTFTVTLSAPSSRAVRVSYATADGTASAPSDYAAAAGTVEFAPGETSKPVSVTVNGDTTVEADERFSLNLSSPSGARIADAQGFGTIFNDDVTVVPLPPQLPAPVPGERLNVVPKSGTVTIKLRGTSRFVALQAGQQVPVGSVIDTTKGRVTLVAASDRSGGTATADFSAGIFEVGQAKTARPITTLELVERLSCGRGRASAAARRKKKRRLWGDGSGRFRTEGSYSSATVRGTRWLVEDRCTNSLTRVAVGRVTVRDFAKRKTVIVRAGNQYVARRRANG
jgi:hypothetical protein